MIAKRIAHKTECDHAQTPYARRKCRAAKLAAAEQTNAAPAPAPVKPAAATAAPRTTGWSKAARRRAGHTGRSHPLGEEVIARGQGYTVYRDGITGRGEVQIWDES